ncbi:MAG TPA: glycoside hydrolase family 2, partial [Bacillota bacterium]|nr:glycoside hydrolase family 2 [Bacillota bacterium]
MKNETKAENLQENIHDETYFLKYQLQNLNHSTLIFTENRPKESLNGRWQFTVDPYDTGLRANWNELT